jgi:hypothetical protein
MLSLSMSTYGGEVSVLSMRQKGCSQTWYWDWDGDDKNGRHLPENHLEKKSNYKIRRRTKIGVPPLTFSPQVPESCFRSKKRRLSRA